MLLNGEYVNDVDISRIYYNDGDCSSRNKAIIERRIYGAGSQTVNLRDVVIPCTREEYKRAIMYLERNMALKTMIGTD